MATTADYLNKLVEQKNTLADNLVTKGVTATHSETLETLVPKVLDISGGGGETTGYISDGLICFSEMTDFLAYNTVSDEELGRNVNNCDGVNGYLSKQKSEIMSQIAGNPFTIQVLCKTTQTDEMGMIFGFVFDRAYQSAMLMTYNGCLALERSNGRIKSGIIINNGDWHMLTAAYNGETMRIYADGVLAASENNIWNIPNDAFIKIGFWLNGIGYFNGKVANAVIYNRALSDSEILQNWEIDVERYGIGEAKT